MEKNLTQTCFCKNLQEKKSILKFLFVHWIQFLSSTAVNGEDGKDKKFEKTDQRFQVYRRDIYKKNNQGG